MEETIAVRKTVLETIATLADRIINATVAYNPDKTIMMERVIVDNKDAASKIDYLINGIMN